MKRAVEVFAVVYAAAENYLRADGDARVGKTAKIGKLFARKAVGKHLAAKLGVCGMYRNVYRRYVHLNDALDLALADVGECDVISVKEGKARIIVLEIAGFAHSGRVLVDEAEDAFVFAGLLFVHQRGCEFKTDLKIVFLLAEAEIFCFSVAEDGQLDFLVAKVETVVENIVYFV